MASYSKRSGKWQARISWYENGKRKTKSKAGFSTKAIAKKWAVDNESQLNKGVAIDKDISFSDYYDQWVKTYKENKVADITMNRYNITGTALKDFFGGTSIKKVDRETYQQFINEYGSSHAPATVKKVNSIIRACVKSAILDDYIIKDFTQRIELTSNESKVLNVDYLNLDEIHRLITATTKGIEKRPGFTSRYMIATAIYTGMRLSEIQALTWKDIDWLHKTIDINKSWNMRTNNFKKTKNESSNRKIGINSKLIKLLIILRNHSSSNMVFMNQYGTIPTSNAVNKTLRSFLESLKINRHNFHFHSLRHSHVALLLANNIDLYTISKRLGHSNISTTANVYAYLVDEYKEKQNDKIANIMNTI